MNLWQSFANLFLIKEIVSQTGEVHFRRWRILATPWFNIYLHQILKSDEDNHSHDHPWSFASLLLKGSYKERVSFAPKHYGIHYLKYKAGQVVVHDAQDAHSITLLTPVVWTLVFTFGTKRLWGYRISPTEWIDFKLYRKLKREGELPLSE